MTTNLEDQMLRDVLAQQADSHGVPGYDPAAIAHRARARRRRHRAFIGGAAMAVTVAMGAVGLSLGGLDDDQTSREVVPQGTLHRVNVAESASAPTIPYCQPRSGDMSSDILHVDGVAFATACSWSPDRRHLWYHAGRTVMSSELTGLQALAGDRLFQLSDAAPVHPRIGLGGRYLAWFEGNALVLYDFVAEARAARTPLPDGMRGTLSTLVGVDPNGRAYVHLGDGSVWVLQDRGRWTRVQGLPPGRSAEPWGYLSYLTPDGLAVQVQDTSADQPVGRSVEGRVTHEGAFEATRTVPLGTAVWSPDRSRVVQLTARGFRAHPADDLGSSVALDVPVDPTDVPRIVWDAQWESSASVLVTSAVTANGAVSLDAFASHRCSAVTGDCRVLPAGIALPLSAGARTGG